MTTLFVNRFTDIDKIVIWAEGDENAKRPRLTFGFRDGNPRLVAHTGGTGAEAMFAFPSDAPTMTYIFNMLKEIAVGEPGKKIAIESLTTLYENNQPTKNKKLVATLYIGKTNEGIVYMSVIAENKPKLVFTIKPSPYHIFRDSEKNEIPVSKISEKLSVGIADLCLNVLSDSVFQYSKELYVEGKRKQTVIKGSSSVSAVTLPKQEHTELKAEFEDIPY